MRAITIIALHDLKLTLRDRSAVFWMFVLPIVFATFFGLVMGGHSGAPSDGTVRLSVVDLDGSDLSKKLISYLDDKRLEVVLMSSAERAVAENPVRTLVIPFGFETSVLAGEQVMLRLEKEPDTSMEAALVAQARIVRAATRILGALIRTESGLPENTESLAPLVSVEVDFAGRRETAPSGFSQSVPGNTAMFVLLVTLTYGAASISSERSLGLLRRLVTAPVSPAEIILGKVAGRFVVSGSQILVLVGFAALARAAGWLDMGGSLLSVLLVLLVYGACVAPLGVAFGAWFKDPDRAASVGVMTTMAMAAFGGCWWPLEVVSKPLQLFALAFPTGWVMKAMHGLISFNHSIGEIVPALLVLAAFGLGFTVLAVRSLRVD